ncbi:unnamed protein product [Enterobius vermicularis]|uniref:Mitotic spindle checkpoint protein MAD2 n=1 Tax=Enterobius vermicularis TaxID=51028 RepID=A0A0N4V098_ENTVE|nr:unnamed protein product [Enterobius vermicularis]
MNESKRLDFCLIDVSSCDTELQVDNELLRSSEWISARHCQYPQTIVMQLAMKSKLEKIQILCHSVYIPTLIDLYAMENDDNPNGEFTHLGTVRFKEAHNTKEKTELKTIFTDVVTNCLKFKVHENYVDDERNPFNKVGLKLVAMYGSYIYANDAETEVSQDDLSSVSRSTSPRLTSAKEKPLNVKLRRRSLVRQSSAIGELDDKMAMLEEQRHAALQRGNIAEANKAEQLIGKITIIKKGIERMDDGKITAIENDDLETAAKLKAQIKNVYSKWKAETDLSLSTEKNDDDFAKSYSPKQDFQLFSHSPKTVGSPAGRRKLSSSSKNNKFLEKENTYVAAALMGKRLVYSPVRKARNADQGGIGEEELLNAINPSDRAFASKAITLYGVETVSSC